MGIDRAGPFRKITALEYENSKEKKENLLGNTNIDTGYSANEDDKSNEDLYSIDSPVNKIFDQRRQQEADVGGIPKVNTLMGYLNEMGPNYILNLLLMLNW